MWIVFINNPIYAQDGLPEIEVVKLSPNLYRFSRGVNNWVAQVGSDIRPSQLR